MSNTLESGPKEQKEVTTSEDSIKCTCSISESTYQAINKRLKLLKESDGGGHSKQVWIIQAIKEKIESENNSNNQQLIIKERTLQFRLSQYLNEKILEKVESRKKTLRSYSKKKWLEEAIHAKLQRDEEKRRSEIEKKLNKVIEKSKSSS